MARVSPAVTLAVVAALCALAVFVGPRRAAAPAAPILGVLFSVGKDTPTASGTAPAPAAERPVVSLAAPAPSSRRLSRKDSSVLKDALAEKHPKSAPRKADLAVAASVAVSSAGPLVRPEPAAAAEALPPQQAKAALQAPAAATFTELDEALRQSPTTQALNLRVKKGGVAFRITHVGRVGQRAAARFAIANEEPSDFFLSVVNVSAGGSTIPAETAGPYACRSGQEIFGVAHFDPAAAAGKRLTVELVQSGGERRRFQLALEYPF